MKAWYSGFLEKSNDGAYKLTLTIADNGRTFVNVTYAGEWTGWKELPIAVPPMEYDVPFSSGFESHPVYGSKYHKNKFGEVTLNFLVRRSDGESIQSEAIFGTLPVGYRPSIVVLQPAMFTLQDQSRTGGAYVEVWPDGRLRFVTDQATVHDFGCSITYLASG